MPIIEAAARFTRPDAPEPNHYMEHLRSADLAVGTYSIPAGALDDQTPHTADEVYVVTSGHATFTETDLGGQTHSYPVGPGATIYVPAGVAHRFVEVTEDLVLVVIFAPPLPSPRDHELRDVKQRRS